MQLNFGVRLYDSWSARWFGVDPLDSKYPGLSPYVYCADNPIKYIDPNGKWLEWIHNTLIARAFASDAEKIQKYQEASKWADNSEVGNQKPEYSYMHAMRDYILTEEEGNETINRYLNDPYERAQKEGQDEFGVKLHAIMDMTAPSHEGTQEWGRPYLSFYHSDIQKTEEVKDYPKIVGHASRELFISIRRFFATVRLMRQFAQDVKDKKKINISQYQALFNQYMNEESDEERESFELTCGDGL